jgi:hypothetical protein
MAGLSLSEMVGDDPRFLVSDLDKALFDAVRPLPDDEKRALLALIKARPGPKSQNT